MSVKVMGKVWEHSQAKGTARLVLLAIADHCNPTGVAWPSLSRLAQYVNVDRRNVIAAINKLVETGELERVQQGKTGRATTYRIVLTSDASVTSDATVTSDASITQVVTPASPQPSYNRHSYIYKGKGDFDAFWKQYPKKVGKGAALKSYQKALRKTSHQEIMAGVAKYNPDPDYICNPSTWLNQERWSDEPDSYQSTNNRNTNRQGGGDIVDAVSRFEGRRTVDQ